MFCGTSDHGRVASAAGVDCLDLAWGMSGKLIIITTRKIHEWAMRTQLKDGLSIPRQER